MMKSDVKKKPCIASNSCHGITYSYFYFIGCCTNSTCFPWLDHKLNETEQQTLLICFITHVLYLSKSKRGNTTWTWKNHKRPWPLYAAKPKAHCSQTNLSPPSPPQLACMWHASCWTAQFAKWIEVVVWEAQGLLCSAGQVYKIFFKRNQFLVVVIFRKHAR